MPNRFARKLNHGGRTGLIGVDFSNLKTRDDTICTEDQPSRAASIRTLTLAEVRVAKFCGAVAIVILLFDLAGESFAQTVTNIIDAFNTNFTRVAPAPINGLITKK